MANMPLWKRILICAPFVAMGAYAAFQLLSRLALGTTYDRISIVTLLVAWVAAYLIWGKKLNALFRNSNSDSPHA
jgi:hypothetical protein